MRSFLANLLKKADESIASLGLFPVTETSYGPKYNPNRTPAASSLVVGSVNNRTDQETDTSWIQKISTPSNPTDLFIRLLDTVTSENQELHHRDIALACYDIVGLLNYPIDELPEKVEYQQNKYNLIGTMTDVANFLIAKETPLYPTPREIYEFCFKSPPLHTTPARDHFPWIPERSADDKTLLATLRARAAKSPLIETDYDEGYSRKTDQEIIKEKLLEAAKIKVVSIFDDRTNTVSTAPNRGSASRTGRLEKFFQQLISNNLMSDFFELYHRYRNDPHQREAFEEIERIVKDASLFSFWVKVLGKKAGLVAFNNAPVFQRHRLKDQPTDQPDQRHPFDILGGEYYRLHASRRTALITQYFTARTHVSVRDFPKALESIKKGISHYHPKTKKDRAAKDALQQQVDILNSITDWNDAQNQRVLWEALSAIREIMELVIQYQSESLEAGIQFGDFNCNAYAQMDDLYRLDLTAYENTMRKTDATVHVDDILTPETTEIIKRLMERVDAIQDIHIYPSYLLAAMTYCTIARAYSLLTKSLILSIPSDSILIKPASCRVAMETGMELTRNDMNYQRAIDRYKSNVNTCFNQALTMACAAAELESTGNYDAIAHNVTVRQSLSFLTDGKCYESLTDFYESLKATVAGEWEALHDYSCRSVRIITLPTCPAASWETVEAIVRHHAIEANDHTHDGISVRQ